jgi:hypothetical protein
MFLAKPQSAQREQWHGIPLQVLLIWIETFAALASLRENDFRPFPILSPLFLFFFS